MKKDFSITRKIWNGINIEIRFDRYFIQFDDGQWQARVEIESLNRASLPDCKCGYKEIIIEADEVDCCDRVEEFAFNWLNTHACASQFKAQKPLPNHPALF
ncbi:MAG: hypothetical protein J0L55_06160 [Caulobacterales bacterium]|nr:hypothetical protein [Caulobacterales bacterium]MCA0373611.1 hypothetical protein [Pseudomonadota bacterium]